MPLSPSRRPGGRREDEEVVIGAALKTRGCSRTSTVSTSDGKKLGENILVTRMLKTG